MAGEVAGEEEAGEQQRPMEEELGEEVAMEGEEEEVAMEEEGVEGGMSQYLVTWPEE